jgi:hypothetical protein
MEESFFELATLILSEEQDLIVFTTKNLTSTHPILKDQALFQIKCQQGYGETWIKENFPKLPYKIIDFNC